MPELDVPSVPCLGRVHDVAGELVGAVDTVVQTLLQLARMRLLFLEQRYGSGPAKKSKGPGINKAVV